MPIIISGFQTNSITDKCCTLKFKMWIYWYIVMRQTGTATLATDILYHTNVQFQSFLQSISSDINNNYCRVPLLLFINQQKIHKICKLPR